MVLETASESSEWLGPEELDDDLVRQGDCLILQNPDDDIGPVQYGVVITADCDFAQRKTSGHVSYVPLIPLGQYVFRFWIPESIEAKKHSERCLDAARKLILERARETHPDAKPLSDIGVFRLAENGIESAFPQADNVKKRAEKLAAYLAATKSLAVLRNPPPGITVDVLRQHTKTFLENCDLGTTAKLLERAADSLREAVTGNGAYDVYPVSTVDGSKTDPHVVMLRFVRTIPEVSVTTSMVDFRFGKKQACRVGRFRYQVKYECLQRFGRLFTRIGKPDPINNACKESIQAALGRLGSVQ